LPDSHVQITATRSTGQFIALALTLLIGAGLLSGTLDDVMAKGVNSSFVAPFVFGILFSLGALVVLYGLLFPVEWRGIVTEDAIRCFKNDKLKKQFDKKDIDYLGLNTLLDHSSHWIRLTDGTEVRLTKLYFEDHAALGKALTDFDYPLKPQ
jgi:hypothetical protein